MLMNEMFDINKMNIIVVVIFLYVAIIAIMHILIHNEIICDQVGMRYALLDICTFCFLSIIFSLATKNTLKFMKKIMVLFMVLTWPYSVF